MCAIAPTAKQATSIMTNAIAIRVIPSMSMRDLNAAFKKIFHRFSWFEPATQEEQSPLKAELLCLNQMTQHAKSLAENHGLNTSRYQDRLLRRLDANEQVLIATNKLLTTAVKAKQRIAPSGEWLLDNFYLIEEQIRTARRHFPSGYSRELPRLAQGASAGLPRVYDIALNVICHGDGRIDGEALTQFVASYQTVTALTLGELWAIPIMLRLALIENLRRVSSRIITARQHMQLAQQWANQMLEMAENDCKNLILVTADMARSKPPMTSAFVAELTRQLQGHGSALALPLTWVEQQLVESSLTIEQLVQAESQLQAADQVSINNTITSLRWLAAMDWRDFVEANSGVEQLLRQDLNGIYSNMDFATRDTYRQVIDGLAKRSTLSEIDIAHIVLKMAQQADTANSNNPPIAQPASHIGYYLIDLGINQLEAAVGARISLLDRIRAFFGRMPLTLYLGSILLLTLLISACLLTLAPAQQLTGWRFILLAILSLLGASQLASALVNWMATLLVQPKRLPRMDYSKGIQQSMQTLVVIPTMLSSTKGIEQLLEVLEVRFLGNRDQQLHFALLTDFHDAAQQTQPPDAALLNQARLGIEQLNAKYPSSSTLQQHRDRFFLLHRPRSWNAQEHIWMGSERKRGKLADLNTLLRSQNPERFSLIVGDISALSQVKYVITLDTDTQLPRESAQQLVGTMAHPLNQPRFDTKKQCVVAGYGILQPRMAASLSSENLSRYAQLCGEEPGIDPYTRSISDVYQDLFAEGSYIGKGIYDLDAFEQALHNRLPENQILSHDLLEGCYAGAGLISDIHLYEEYPARYDVDLCRRERWIRGDWQIMHWLLPWVKGGQGQRCSNPLSALSRWKILDNLRRSIEPLALLLLLSAGWFVTVNPLTWTVAVIAIFLLPALLSALLAAVRKPTDMRLSHHLRSVLHDFIHQISQISFRLACLPHEAVFNLAAILRSVHRMLFSHRRLLEWHVADGKSPLCENGLAKFYNIMWAAPVIAIVLATGLVWLPAGTLNQTNLVVAVPLLLLWFIAPAFAWWLSQPQIDNEPALSCEQNNFLHQMARRTWAFFDHFSTAADNWLIPDNFQETPGQFIAHRTSPTNIGLSLLANVTAYDFGFIAVGDLLRRTSDCFASLDRLERHQGHFYNWYDTQTLLPLAPRYISSVDSGNLAGHLLTLRVALLDLPGQPIVQPRLFAGLSTTLDIVANCYLDKQKQPQANILAVIQSMRSLLNVLLTPVPTSLTAIGISQTMQHLLQLTSYAKKLTECFQANADIETARWADDLHQQCDLVLQDLRVQAPWLRLPSPPASLSSFTVNDNIPTLHQLVTNCRATLTAIDARLATTQLVDEQQWLSALHSQTLAGAELAKQRILICQQLAQRAFSFADMQYAFLYDATRHLLAIGYNVDERRRDTSFYDLLASEARFCTFIAIAQGQLPQQSWFALSRLLTTAGGEPVLVSWNGSMFEYLMPLLVMPTYTGTLLNQTSRAAVARQIAYGNLRSVPWGVSESAYNTFDTNLNYQYHAFGVPGLGLKRGLAEDLVIAPYASALALMVAPLAACENLQRLAKNGLEGRYGLYEAIDYTPSRLSRGQNGVVIHSFMAHHQGMSLLALAFRLLNRPMQQRFESEPLFQSALLLLQERVPKTSVFQPHVDRHAESGALFDQMKASINMPIGAETATPEVQLLSNGHYHVMISNAGGGYSRWRDLAVTRWREDPTCDNWGTFVYVRDTASGDFWSAAHQPTLKPAEFYSALFSEGRAEFRRSDQGIETYTEIVVSPEDDIELRRVRLSNHSANQRQLDVTTYAEVVMALPAADITQPSFSNLFVQTEILEGGHAILCSRRARSADEKTPWMFHLLLSHDNGGGNSEGVNIGAFSSTTDRIQFIGRGRTLVSPQALLKSGELAGSAGSVLDPIIAIRCPMALDAGKTVIIDLVTGMADSRTACLALIAKYQDRHLTDRVFDLAWTHSGVLLRQINASETDVLTYRRLASSILYANTALRADAAILSQNRRGQSDLWGYSISGDLPIVLLKIASSDHIELARQLILCHAYWRLKGLIVDLVIWNEEQAGYRQQLQEQIMGLIATGSEAHYIDRSGGIFVRSSEQISSEDRILLQAVSRAIIVDTRGTLAEQVNRRTLSEKRVAALVPNRMPDIETATATTSPPQDLLLSNGIGGFSKDGREYIITTSQTNKTPLPWVNVLANAQFGTVITESGMAYTWSENAHEFRITPWSEDSTGTSGGEAFYLRDEDSGYFWSPTPLPSCGKTPYVTRHGFGYSIFEHNEDGISSELCVYVDLHAAVKFSVLKVRNNSGRTRRLTATGYVEWVLGELRSKSALHVVTEIDASSGALLARNAYNSEFGGRVAFFDVDAKTRSISGDRSEFLGRNGTLRHPSAMTRERLPGRVGAALDPCGAIQVAFELADTEERSIIFRLGAGHDVEQAKALALQLQQPGSARRALEQVQEFWQQTLAAVQVQTPDPAINFLANGWLVYQNLACRIWARSGFYQSGGAFGFRDQLQDAMALLHAQPNLLRQHLLHSASRQYPQGDVQHWWHPPMGRGVRTRCSDDYLWLPLATCRYVNGTSDSSVLDELVPYLEGRQLNDDEESYYDLPAISNESASLYQHCVQAITYGLKFGAKGLPLMGSGDWNDGMNLVGIHGKGESVWLGFFLYKILLQFADVARVHKDDSFAQHCEDEAKTLRANLAQHAWDGDWYRRAWFDDGTPLGSKVNTECTIDSIAQSWSVLSGAGDAKRSLQAMAALDKQLVRRDHKLIQLLHPPFDTSALEPGYIKGYVPGVRENGGQYTHAAIWACMAFAKLGDSTRAWELLNLINPINHGSTAEQVAIYKAEPYVVAADVYAAEPHIGRGGWTWYTGSAGWFYRLILESLLGLTRHADQLKIAPCMPASWSTYAINYRFGSSNYHIIINQISPTAELIGTGMTLDGKVLPPPYIPLLDDQQNHEVVFTFRQAKSSTKNE